MPVVIYSAQHGGNGGPALNALSSIMLAMPLVIVILGYAGYRLLARGERGQGSLAGHSARPSGPCQGHASVPRPPARRWPGDLPADGFGVEILLQRTDDAKHGKNRVHLDLRTRDLDGEVSRLPALGATRQATEPVEEDGWAWHVLLDPDGNEFCVLRPPPGYWANRPGLS